MNHVLLNNYDVLGEILKRNGVWIMIKITEVVIWLDEVFGDD